MIAYLGKPELKDQMLALAAEHRAADHIIHGVYMSAGLQGEWQGGCAVGCTLESARRLAGEPLEEFDHGNHAAYEEYLGIPEALARLEDGIFEGLDEATALDWPRRFLAAIRPGADLSMVWPRFAHWLLTCADGPVQAGAAKRLDVAESVARVAALYQRWIDGTKPSDTEWREARSAAAAAYAAYADAYADAADAAAAAYAAYAAYAYADAADAAYAAADAAAADAAAAAAEAAVAAAAAYAAYAGRASREAERRRQADKLIALLEQA
jgi:hypothetical protein